MNIDFVFFDGQLWPYDEWAKIMPLTWGCDKPITDNWYNVPVVDNDVYQHINFNE